MFPVAKQLVRSIAHGVGIRCPGCGKNSGQLTNATKLHRLLANFADVNSKSIVLCKKIRQIMIKRILTVAGCTIVAIAGFTLWQGHASADGHDHDGAAEHGAHSGAHSEEEEYRSIPLTQKQMEAVDIQMGLAEMRELDATVNVNGTLVLRPQDMAEVSSLAGGVVKGIYVKDGQAVSRGQVVATVENTEIVSLQREYFSAYKESQLAKAEYDRQVKLSESGAGVKKNVQAAQKEWQTAYANMVGIGRQLSQLGISAGAVAKGKFTTTFPLRGPIAGTVSQLTASLGSYADMQTPLMKIRNNSAVECDLNVFEKDIAKVKVGDRVLLSLTNQPGVSVTGRVYGMNKYFNDGTKSVAVHVKLDNAGGANLFDGMYVAGSIATGRQECNTLPSKAIVSSDGKNYIFALNKKTKKGDYEFSRHEVTTGVSQNGYTEVLLCGHIRKDQQIVTANAVYLASLTGEHGEHNH